MDPLSEYRQLETRRLFFGHAALGLGIPALASILGRSSASAAEPATKAKAGGLPGLPHFAPKAKRAIYLFMSGAPSQLDLFDYKPKMADYFDKDLPDSVRMGLTLIASLPVTVAPRAAPLPEHRSQDNCEGAYRCRL